MGNFDQDGDTDIIAGNLVLNTKLRKPGGSGKSVCRLRILMITEV